MSPAQWSTSLLFTALLSASLPRSRSHTSGPHPRSDEFRPLWHPLSSGPCTLCIYVLYVFTAVWSCSFHNQNFLAGRIITWQPGTIFSSRHSRGALPYHLPLAVERQSVHRLILNLITVGSDNSPRPYRHASWLHMSLSSSWLLW